MPARRPPSVSTDGRIPCASSRTSAVACFRVLERLPHQQRPVLCSVRQRLLRQLERDHRMDQALLRAVPCSHPGEIVKITE